MSILIQLEYVKFHNYNNQYFFDMFTQQKNIFCDFEESL